MSKEIPLILRLEGADETKRGIDGVGESAKKGGETIAAGVFKGNVAFGALKEVVKVAGEVIQKVFETAVKVVEKTVEVIGEITKKMYEFAKSSVEAASQEEMLNIQFTALLGNGDAATKMLDDLFKFSQRGIFETDTIKEYGKNLLSFGYSASEVVPTLNMLGDITSVLGADTFPMFIDVLEKAKQKGEVTGLSLRPLINAHFDLASALGMTNEEMNYVLDNSSITYDALVQGFTKVTSKGGVYYEMMDKMGQTVPAQIKSMKDAWTEFQEGFAKDSGLLDATKSGLGVLRIALDGLMNTLKLDLFPVLHDFWANHKDKIIAAVSALANSFNVFAENAIPYLLKKAQEVFGFLKDWWERDGEIVRADIQRVVDAISGSNGLGSALNGVLSPSADMKKSLMDLITEGITTLTDTLVGKNGDGGVVGNVQELIKQLTEKNTIDTFTTSMKDLDTTLQAINNTIKDFIKFYKDLEMISRVLTAIVTLGGSEFLRRGISDVSKAMAGEPGIVNPVTGKSAYNPGSDTTYVGSGNFTATAASNNLSTYSFGHANGGIIPGNSYVGDLVSARVNSGEMVINRDQQAGLFEAIKGLKGKGSVNFNAPVYLSGGRSQQQTQMGFANLLMNAV